VDLPTKEANEIRAFAKNIPDSEIYTVPDDPSYGREDEPHITVKYGLKTNTPKDIVPIIKGHPPITAKMGKVSIFENDKYDVVKVEVDSPELRALNKKIEQKAEISLPNGETFDYLPHATIAYVQPGQGKKYVGDKSFAGKEITFDSLTFSARDGKLHQISLSGSSSQNQKNDPQTTFPSTDEPQEQASSQSENTAKIEPGATVTWKNKKGLSFVGTLVSKKSGSKSTWQIARDNGKRTFLLEKSFSVVPKDKASEIIPKTASIEDQAGTKPGPSRDQAGTKSVKTDQAHDQAHDKAIPSRIMVKAKNQAAFNNATRLVYENPNVKGHWIVSSRGPGENYTGKIYSVMPDGAVDIWRDGGKQVNEEDVKKLAPVDPDKKIKEQTAQTYGSKNKVFTKDAAEKARELLRKKLSGNQLNSGIDPEVMLAGIQLAGYHVEAGARTFAAYSKAMVEDAGETIKPYLRSFYEGVRHYPGFDSTGMDDVVDLDATSKSQSSDKVKKSVNARINDKYADILSLPEDLTGPEILDGINEGTLTPRALDKFLEKSDSLEEDIQAAKAAVADRIGDLKETYRYESEKEGKALEEYIDSLLVVLSKDRVPGNTVSDRYSQVKDGKKTGNVSDDSGINQKENENVSQHNTGTDTERDSGNTGTQDGMGKENISDGSGPAEGIDGEGIQRTYKENVSGSGQSGPGYETSPVGKRGDQSPYSTDGQDRFESSPARSDNDTRGGDVGYDGEQFERIPAETVVKTSQKGTDIQSRIAAQKKASKIKTVHADLSNIQETLPILHTGQQEDVLFAEKRFAKANGHGVMFTNGTGTGKTFSGLGIIKRFARDGKKNILVIAPDNVIINAWMKSAKLFDLSMHKIASTNDSGKDITITTYANFRGNKTLVSRDWDLVIADESHELSMNKAGSKTGSLVMFRAITKHPKGFFDRANILYPDLFESRGKSKKDHEAWLAAVDKVRQDIESDPNRSKAVFLSATPFAYEKNIDYAEGYLFDYGPDLDDSGYNSTDAYQRFMVEHFGYRMRYNKLTEPDKEVNRGIMQRQFNSWLKKEGVLSSRILSVDYDYDRKFILTESAVGQKIDEGFKFLYDNHKEYDALFNHITEEFDYLKRRYLLEAIKAKEVIQIIKDHLAHGRKVVVFHDYIKGGATNPFDVRGIAKKGDNRLSKQARDFIDTRPDLVNLPIKNLSSPLITLQGEFPDLLVVNGQTVSKKNMQENINKFNDDATGPCVLMVQSDKDKGWSGHDTTGKHQRVLINLGLPTRPTRAIQQEGRIYRVGQASDAMFRYLNTGTNWERWAFASTIAQRASAAENLAMGEEARALQDSFINTFEESDAYPAGTPGEGKGGKAQDIANNAALTEWDRAMSFYFVQQKKTSRTKAKEGKDYFATPEPLGLKMVEWAGVESGNKILEPSAGHGAIARWFPENIDGTAIEPSAELSSRLKMVTPDSKVIQDNFENHHVTNKYDAIVMNPPFGTAGKTAMEHVEKAFRHLKNGGRIVAIIPNGPTMEKRMNKFIYGTDDKGNSLNPNAHVVAFFDLPSVTFERVGTKVNSRIIIIDKASEDMNVADHAYRDYSGAKDINDFFSQIEHAVVPERTSNGVMEDQAQFSTTADKKVNTDSKLSGYHGSREQKIEGKLRPTQYGDFGKGVYLTPDKAFAKTFTTFENFNVSGEVAKKSPNGKVFKVDINIGKDEMFIGDDTKLTQKEIEYWEDEGEDLTGYVTREDLMANLGGRNFFGDNWSISGMWDSFFDEFGYKGAFYGEEIVIRDAEDLSIPIESIDSDKSRLKFSISQDKIKIATTDTTPAQGITLSDIKSQYKNQQITTQKDGTLSIRFTNGKGIQIETVNHIGGNDIRVAVKSGRMKRDGVILGKYQARKITINMNMANIETAIHENYHALKALGMITPADEKTLDNFTKMLKAQKKYRYDIQEDVEENQANTLAQLVTDRANYREGSKVRSIIQKVMDFFDALVHIGRQSARKLAREYESGEIYGRGVDGRQTTNYDKQDAPQFSVDTDTISTKEKNKAYSQIAAGLKSVIKNRKNKGPNYKKDIGVIENTLGLMSHYSEGIPALKRTFEELLKRPEWKFQKENELYKNGEESMIGTMEDLKKHNKAAYADLSEYLVDRDINQVGAILIQDEDGTWTIKSKKDERTGKRSILEEGILTKKQARDLIIQYEVDEYPDSAARDALRAFRTMTANLHDFYAESWETLMQEYEERGLTLPEVVTQTKSGEVRVDLKVALAKMGERSSYYFPRQRSNGDWRVYAEKEGEHPFVEYRDFKSTADYLAGKMEAQGYTVKVEKVGSMSEDIYQNVKSILSMQVMVNQALSETKMDVKLRKLEDVGLKGEWRGDDYVVPGGGVYEWSESVLKELGGQPYSDLGRKGNSWSPGYRFDNAPKDMPEIVTNAIFRALNKEPDVSFEIAQNLVSQLADTLRARGSRARMIARSDAIGKDVPVGYETDPVKAIAQAVNSAAGGYAKQQVALKTSQAITGQHHSWDEWQKQHRDYDALQAVEESLKTMQKNSDTENERIEAIEQEIKELQRERVGVKTESEAARQDRLFRIGRLFREKEKIRKWKNDDQAAAAHKEIVRLRGNIHKEYRQYIQDNMIDSKRQKRAYTDAVNAVENVLKNDEAGDRVINTLKGLASVWFLGGRLSSAAINLTAMGTTVPAAMDAYGGVPLRKTVKHIAKAGKAYASFVTGKGKVSKEDRAILEDIFSRGWVAAQLNMETINALKSGPAQKYGKVVELLMTPFKITEEFNRGVTLFAAYKGIMSENPGMSKDDALAKAKTVSDRAHGIYGVENQPALLRKGRGLRAASAMYIFQTFMHNYFTTLSYMIGRKQAAAATYMILSPMLFGGAASSILLSAVKMIFKAMGEDDPEEKIYQVAQDLFGETGDNIARYGLPGLAGVSLKGSLAPGLPDFKEPLDALGPIGGMMRNIFQGGVNITQGDYLKGIEKITPLAMGNIAKAYRETSEGVTTRAGDQVFFGDEQIKGDLGTGIMRAAGLNPTKIAKPREIQWNETTLKRQYAEKKRRLYSRIVHYHAQPISKKSHSEWRDIVLEIKEFNARVKSNNLTDIVSQITGKTIKARMRRAFRPNKRERERI
jgi:2'-5' RNA ligase